MMDDLPDVLARLTTQMETLERRVYALEHPSQGPGTVAALAENPTVAPDIGEAVPTAQVGKGFSVLGTAMLGIAGAYLLRAVAESSIVPKPVIVALAFAYACMWLVWATRPRVEAWFASTTYAGTSALILGPMLWELTLRFKVLPPSMAAALLSLFVMAAAALSWKHRFGSVFWLASATGVATALALMMATRDMVPFVAALLLMAVISEFAAGRNRRQSARPLVAVANDLAIAALIYVYAANIHAEYKAASTVILLAPGIVLLLIYGAGTAFHTLVLRQRISYFEIGQALIAFLLASASVLYFGSSAGATGLGVVCLLFSAVGFAAVFHYFDRSPEQHNFHVYATGSAALFLLGCFLCLPPLWLALCLALAAVVATFLGVRMGRLTLEYHGLIYLAAAAFASGLVAYDSRVLAGSFPVAPGWIVWTVSAATILCYTVGGRFQGEHWNQRLHHLLAAVLAVSATAAVLICALVWLMAVGITPGTSHVAVIRTLTTCAMALALAYSGSRWRRIELVWIAYGTLALVAVKLLFEDLRHGHPGFIAASIFLYAVTLILVPRLVRIGQKVA